MTVFTRHDTARRSRAPLSKTLALTVSLWCAGLAQAEDRALLIGVGDYAAPEATSLPGIELDLENMREVATSLGFHAIEVLRDGQATLSRVRGTFRSWLTRGVGPNDRVLIYFSGHGTRVEDTNNDETSDHLDEALALSDLRVDYNSRGQPKVTGILVDDEFGEMLAGLRSNNVLVVIDACHSGSGTKSLGPLRSAGLGIGSGVSKMFKYTGMPTGRGDGGEAFTADGMRGMAPAGEAPQGAPPVADNDAYSIVTLSAARDDEESIATDKGSLFTLGVAQAVARAGANRQTLTPNQVRDAALEFVGANTRAGQLFHPQISGPIALRNKPLALIDDGPLANSTATTISTRWDAIAGQVHAADDMLLLRINQTRYTAGDRLVIDVDLPRDGYLNIVSVDAAGEATVLFPNSRERNNWVRAGGYRLPTPGMNFKLVARPPYGRTLVAAFLSPTDNDFYSAGINRDGRGRARRFAGLSPLSTRAFGIEDLTAAGMVTTEVCSPSGC